MKLLHSTTVLLLCFVACHHASAQPSKPSNLRGRGLAKGGNGNGNNGNGNGNNGSNGDDGDVAVPTPPEINEGDSVPSPDDADDDPEADAKSTAKLLDLSLDDATLLLQQQSDFSDVVTALQEDNLFMQAEMPSKPNGEFVIKFKNGIPSKHQKAIDDFKGMNKNAKVKNVATKLSLKDAEARGERLKKKLEKDEYTHVSYSIDGDELELTAKKGSKHKNKDNGKIPPGRTAEILELSPDDEDTEDLSLFLVEQDAEDPSGNEHTYGGRKISGGGYQCTTGFSVITSSGTTGISTAAHCTGMNRFDAVPPESDYATSFQKQHNGYYGDVEWHTTPHWELAEYYALPNTRWPVRNIGYSISKGQVICGYSRMQGTRFCDTVYRTSASQGASSNVVAMTNHNTVGGDSGGPWSFYDTAYGIHKGYTTIDGSRRNTWSRVSYLPYALGVRVRTQ